MVGLVAEPSGLALASRRLRWPPTRIFSPRFNCGPQNWIRASPPTGSSVRGTAGSPTGCDLEGNAQMGPILYLGYLGVLSLMSGFAAFEIIGLNMLGFGQVERDLVLAPTPLAGARAAKAGIWDQHHAAPQPGWMVADGRIFLTLSLLLWWARMYRRARELGLGTHTAWAFASAIWLYLVLGFYSAALDGPFQRGLHRAFSRISTGPRRSPSDTATSSTIPSTCSRSRSSMDRRCYSRCMGDHPGGRPVRRRARGRADPRSRHRRGTRRALLALDDGLQRDDGIDPSLGVVVRGPRSVHGGIGILSPGPSSTTGTCGACSTA